MKRGKTLNRVSAFAVGKPVLRIKENKTQKAQMSHQTKQANFHISNQILIVKYK